MTENKKLNSSPKIDGYAMAVETLAKKKSELVFGNEGFQHAAIVMKNIFKFSKNIVRIYANNFNGAVSNNLEYCKELENFIVKTKGKLLVICEKTPNENSKGYQIIKKYSELKKDKVKLKLTNGYISKQLKNTLKEGDNFTTGDNNIFRLETDRETFEASVSFNSPPLTKHLNNIFDREFQINT